MMNLNPKSSERRDPTRRLALAPRIEPLGPVQCDTAVVRLSMPSATDSLACGPAERTALARTPARAGVRLVFLVSRDEEYVRLHALCGRMAYDLGERTHNYLLLTLARRRLEDAANNLPEAACGWLYSDSLSHDPSMAPARLNIGVFRVRRQFASLGICDGTRVIERRVSTRQLRLGFDAVSIQVV